MKQGLWSIPRKGNVCVGIRKRKSKYILGKLSKFLGSTSTRPRFRMCSVFLKNFESIGSIPSGR